MFKTPIYLSLFYFNERKRTDHFIGPDGEQMLPRVKPQPAVFTEPGADATQSLKSKQLRTVLSKYNS